MEPKVKKPPLLTVERKVNARETLSIKRSTALSLFIHGLVGTLVWMNAERGAADTADKEISEQSPAATTAAQLEASADNLESKNNAVIEQLEADRERTIDEFIETYFENPELDSIQPPVELYFEMDAYRNILQIARQVTGQAINKEALIKQKESMAQELANTFQQRLQILLERKDLRWTGDPVQDYPTIQQALFFGEQRFFDNPYYQETHYQRDARQFDVQLASGYVNCTVARVFPLVLEQIYRRQGLDLTVLGKYQALAWADHWAGAYDEQQLQEFDLDNPVQDGYQSVFTEEAGEVLPLAAYAAEYLVEHGATVAQQQRLASFLPTTTKWYLTEPPPDEPQPLRNFGYNNKKETDLTAEKRKQLQRTIEIAVNEYLEFIAYRGVDLRRLIGSENFLVTLPPWVNDPWFVQYIVEHQDEISEFEQLVWALRLAGNRAAVNKMIDNTWSHHVRDYPNIHDPNLLRDIFYKSMWGGQTGIFKHELIVRYADSNPDFSEQWRWIFNLVNNDGSLSYSVNNWWRLTKFLVREGKLPNSFLEYESIISNLQPDAQENIHDYSVTELQQLSDARLRTLFEKEIAQIQGGNLTAIGAKWQTKLYYLVKRLRDIDPVLIEDSLATLHAKLPNNEVIPLAQLYVESYPERSAAIADLFLGQITPTKVALAYLYRTGREYFQVPFMREGVIRKAREIYLTQPDVLSDFYLLAMGIYTEVTGQPEPTTLTWQQYEPDPNIHIEWSWSRRAPSTQETQRLISLYQQTPSQADRLHLLAEVTMYNGPVIIPAEAILPADLAYILSIPYAIGFTTVYKQPQPSYLLRLAYDHDLPAWEPIVSDGGSWWVGYYLTASLRRRFDMGVALLKQIESE